MPRDLGGILGNITPVPRHSRRLPAWHSADNAPAVVGRSRQSAWAWSNGSGWRPGTSDTTARRGLKFLRTFGTPEGEGARFVLSELSYIWRVASMQLPQVPLGNVLKYCGYRLGRAFMRLPGTWRLQLSMTKGYWNTPAGRAAVSSHGEHSESNSWKFHNRIPSEGHKVCVRALRAQ